MTTFPVFSYFIFRNGFEKQFINIRVAIKQSLLTLLVLGSIYTTFITYYNHTPKEWIAQQYEKDATIFPAIKDPYKKKIKRVKLD
jgi:hypothetical protein